MNTLIRIASVSTLLLGWRTAPVQAFQDLHILHPIATLEQALRYEPLQAFSRTGSVIVALQYWLAPPLLPHTSLDRSRAASDEAYARHIGNMNVLAYLIRHRDNNPGNFLISGTDTPRVFAVDNGVAFRSDASDRGHYWSNLNVTRISAATAERLRAIDLADLERGLSVVAQFELQGEALQQVEPGVALDPSRGTRRRGDTLQFGLSSGEIREVHGRLQRLLQMLDTGRIATF
jgi:hypothetical protein